MNNLWHKKWPDQFKVPYSSFLEAFLAYLHGGDKSASAESTTNTLSNVLKSLIIDFDGNVTPLTCKYMICWFGPIIPIPASSSASTTFIQRVSSIVKNWFFGKLDYRKAVDILGNNPPGTFLVRVNIGTSCGVEVAPYTIVVKYRGTSGEDETVQVRVYVSSEGNSGLIVKLPNDTKHSVFNTYGMDELINHLQDDNSSSEFFLHVCPGSPFGGTVPLAYEGKPNLKGFKGT